MKWEDLPYFPACPSAVCIHFSPFPVFLLLSSSAPAPAVGKDKSHMSFDEKRNYNTLLDLPL